MSIKNQIAFHLCAAIRANVEDLYAGRIEGADFDQRQRDAWSIAETHEAEGLLRDLLVAALSAAPAAPASDWSHRADLPRWHDDFVSDFAECCEDGEAGV